MRVAIVGAGVSGLVAAYLLHREHDITVFEAGDYPGGHVNTIPVEVQSGTYQVDTGFIVFNEANYPNFRRLLKRIGVGEQPSNMSFSVSSRQDDFEYSSAGANAIFAQRSHLVRPAFYRMLVDKVRFNREVRRLLEQVGEGPTLGEFLDARRYSRTFVDRLIVPQVAAVWSAAAEEARAFPAKYLAQFLDNHGLLQVGGHPRWATVPGGSARYVEAMTRPFKRRIRLSSPVRAIDRTEDWVDITPDHGQPERFDRVIIATHSDQALRMLSQPTPHERDMLSSFEYQQNEVALHTDTGMLPRRRRAWAAWNYHLIDGHTGSSAVTYHMNRLQSIEAPEQFCVTLNNLAGIDDSKIVRTFNYQHPVFTHRSVRAQERHQSVLGANRTYFCGAYWGYGFHEDGVDSALRVAAHFGAALS
ncbi:MAG: FAD-dependent oxidoreductase [Candidatus Dormibacteraeota bacterium]|uniref:FAD-dependent oxidoreductase n=1 Tax=Candidatus Amunia macphersoniae TaxID=3127014 RepID=A0A934KKE5_9BACT|nr:FAD-dependent oxidoreductase [Candidatus Dormibacteraeota bacterium]